SILSTWSVASEW
ncbi:prolyl oligopeptidase, N-terminal beta-propeller domain protein, partial [Vibrio parahaemolyticus V-223/04]